ncbi:MAG: hypothetical protein KC502_18025 [Myxococcales bacterium]|nr:hypothetical protein [Myxococcales bacterium]
MRTVSDVIGEQGRTRSFWMTSSAAAALWVLLALTGCGTDTSQSCAVGTTRCIGSVVWKCDVTGVNWVIERACSPLGLSCVSGVCSATFRADGGGGGPAPDAGQPDTIASQDSGVTEPSDTSTPDTVTPDAGQPDAGTPDAGQPDAGTPDTGQPDAGTPDTGTPDTGQPDTGSPDAGQPDSGVDPYKPGFLLYERVPNIIAKDDLFAVRWHPSGKWALILGRKGLVLRYDVPGQLKKVVSLGKTVSAIEVAADGSFFLIIGTDKQDVGQIWRLNVDGTGQLKPAVASKVSLGIPVAIARSSQGKWAIGSRTSKGSINYVFTWDPVTGLSAPKGFNAYGGLTDILWAEAKLPQFGNSEVLLTTHGYNGSAGKAWLLATGDIIDNGWKSSFGNAGRGAWRPGGSYGIVLGSSSNKVYAYNGAWTKTQLPNVGTAANPHSIAWKPDGTRALVVGRAIGPGLSGTVLELQAGHGKTYDPTAWVKASIPDFDKTPWFAKSNTHLLDADWRPGGGCDEGLIVASDTGTSWSPTFGILIRFYDSGDPACAPTP